METICLWRAVGLLIVVVFGCILAMDDDFLCMEKRTYNITKRIKYQQPVTTEFYEWCMNFPPRCAKSRTEIREKSKMETEEKTDYNKVCCPGFGINKLTNKCIPICPPAFTGKACNESCQEGLWGKSCHRKCLCPNNAKCDPTDGKCICISGWIGVECNVPEFEFTTTKKTLFDWSDPVHKITKPDNIVFEDIFLNKGADRSIKLTTAESMRNEIKLNSSRSGGSIKLPTTESIKKNITINKNNEADRSTKSTTTESMRNAFTRNSNGYVTHFSKSDTPFPPNQIAINKTREADNRKTKTYTSTIKVKPIISTTELGSSTKTYKHTKTETTTMSDSKIIFINKIWSPSFVDHSSLLPKTRKNGSFDDSMNFTKPKIESNLSSTISILITPVETSTRTTSQTTNKNKEESILQFSSTYDIMQVIDKPDTYKNEDVTTNFDDLKNILRPTVQPDQQTISVNPNQSFLPTILNQSNPSKVTQKILENLSIIKSTIVPLISNATLFTVAKEIYKAVTNITHEQTTQRSVFILPEEKIYEGKTIKTTTHPLKNNSKYENIQNKSILHEKTTKSSFQVIVPIFATNATSDQQDILGEILTEPEHITSVAGEKRSEVSRDYFISIVSTAIGVVIAIILIAIVIVFIERYRRRNKNNGMKNIKSICEDEGPTTYIRSIFHNPLPDPPTCASAIKSEPTSPFYRQVVIHAISPMMIENYRGILESHYDHLPCRDPRLASFQPVSRPSSISPRPVAPSPIGSITFQTFNENSNNFEIPTFRTAQDCTIVTMRNENNNSAYSNDYNNEPLYDEIPNIQLPSTPSQTTEAMTEL